MRPRYWGVSKHTLRKWDALGHIRIHRPTGNTAFIEIAEVQAFIRGEKIAATVDLEQRRL